MEARKIIITGGATRIGAAIAKKLSGPNKELVLHFNKSKSKALILKKKLEGNGTKVYLVKGDLSIEKDVNKIVKTAKSKLKYFDCLINNASLFENDKLVEVGYQITSTKNAMSAGPISISAGIAVTVPSGCSWTIV